MPIWVGPNQLKFDVDSEVELNVTLDVFPKINWNKVLSDSLFRGVFITHLTPWPFLPFIRLHINFKTVVNWPELMRRKCLSFPTKRMLMGTYKKPFFHYKLFTLNETHMDVSVCARLSIASSKFYPNWLTICKFTVFFDKVFDSFSKMSKHRPFLSWCTSDCFPFLAMS